MFDYAILKIIWWAILGIIIIVYSTTAGFDFGVTMIMPFLRNEDNRRLALATSMPTWDGNMTWLVFFGGALFVAWPVVYSTAFSGLYFAVFCILWSLFLRPPGFDYRDRINSHIWRRCWDVALFISSVLPVFVFGIAMANCLLGFPFHFDAFDMRNFYTGNFGNLFSGFALIGGFTALSMIIMHGAAHLQRRAKGPLRETARKLHLLFSTLTFILFTWGLILVTTKMSGYHLSYTPINPTDHPLDNIVQYVPHAWAASYQAYPWKFYPLIIFYAGTILSLWSSHMRAYATCFWSSVFTIGGAIAAVGFSLFPFIMPSSTNPNQSLTVWNAASSPYALSVMLYVGLVLLLIIIGYKIFAYHTAWHGKPSIGVEDLENTTY